MRNETALLPITPEEHRVLVQELQQKYPEHVGELRLSFRCYHRGYALRLPAELQQIVWGQIADIETQWVAVLTPTGQEWHCLNPIQETIGDEGHPGFMMPPATGEEDKA